MTPDPGDGDAELAPLAVTIPEDLLEDIDERAAELASATRSGCFRDGLRETRAPLLTPTAHERVAAGYADVAAGRTMSTADAREHLGLDEP